MAKSSSVGPRDEFEFIDIRKISNGYIVSRSHSDAKGNYKRTEVFSQAKPTVQMAEAKPKGEAKPKVSTSPNALSSMAKSAAKSKR